MNNEVSERSFDARALRNEAAARETQIQSTLIEIWRGVLNVNHVSPEDNFFNLGGHSLAAMQVISRIFTELDADLSVQELFDNPTIDALARTVSAAPTIPHDARGLPVERASRSASLPASYAQERLWLLDRLQPNSTAYNIPRAWTLTGPLDRNALRKSVREIVRRHEVLRTTFSAIEGEPYQVIQASAEVDVPLMDLSALPPSQQRAEVEKAALQKLGAPFSLTHGPLVRACILRISEDEHVFVLSVHHICWDRWSADIVLREIGVCYAAYRRGEDATLPQLAFQYADYAVWHRRLVASGLIDGQLHYWARHLADAPLYTTLPTSRERPEVQTFEGAWESFVLTTTLKEQLDRFSCGRGATLFMTLFAVFTLLLHQVTGQERVVVGTDVADRQRAEFENVVGLFLNQLVLHTDLSGDPTFEQLLGRVRNMTLEAYSNQDVPFQRMVQHFCPQRSPAYNPLFQIMFTLHNAPAAQFALPDIAVTELALPRGAAVFDLSLILTCLDNGVVQGSLRYNTALFDRDMIASTIERFLALARDATTAPDRRLSEFARPARTVPAFGGARLKALRDSALGNLAATAAAPVAISLEVIRTSYARPDQQLPVIIEPQSQRFHLTQWAVEHKQLLTEHLNRAGAVLFRGFGVDSVAALEQIVVACSGTAIDYSERSSPRTLLSRGIYTSTDHPASKQILLHNEQSYTLNWPMRIWFCCIQPAAKGGRTLLADVRKVYSRLDPALVDRFAQLQILYVRRFLPGMGLSWQEAFQTTDREQVERYCRDASIECEWNGSHLTTRQIRPAIRRHPSTGELLWFNHAAFFHVSGLQSSIPLNVLGTLDEDELPFGTYYGNGDRIAPDDIANIRRALDTETVGVEWRRGDLLLVDNMLAAHGREPYSGPRQVIVAMSEPYSTVVS